VEPQQQGRTNQPAEQDAERAFPIPETRKELDDEHSYFNAQRDSDE
jgi:hypothetical protein